MGKGVAPSLLKWPNKRFMFLPFSLLSFLTYDKFVKSKFILISTWTQKLVPQGTPKIFKVFFFYIKPNCYIYFISALRPKNLYLQRALKSLKIRRFLARLQKMYLNIFRWVVPKHCIFRVLFSFSTEMIPKYFRVSSSI